MKFAHFFTLSLLSMLIFSAGAFAREMDSYPVVKLQSLDKVTARTMTFEANVGNTVKFGSLYIKIQACKKASPIEQPESAAFLQIWEVKPKAGAPQDEKGDEESQWIFSGWMFASSPALSHMDHPIYDVWVLDCLEAKGQKPAVKKPADAQPGEGEIPAKEAPTAPPVDSAVPGTPMEAVPAQVTPAPATPDTSAPMTAPEPAPAPEAIPQDSEVAPDNAPTQDDAVPPATSEPSTDKNENLSPLGD